MTEMTELKSAYDFPEEVKALFGEYTAMLTEGDSTVAGYLKIQNYDDEILHLEAKYGLRSGADRSEGY